MAESGTLYRILSTTDQKPLDIVFKKTVDLLTRWIQDSLPIAVVTVIVSGIIFVGIYSYWGRKALRLWSLITFLLSIGIYMYLGSLSLDIWPFFSASWLAGTFFGSIVFLVFSLILSDIQLQTLAKFMKSMKGA